jgi:hypothetical protein
MLAPGKTYTDYGREVDVPMRFHKIMSLVLTAKRIHHIPPCFQVRQRLVTVGQLD